MVSLRWYLKNTTALLHWGSQFDLTLYQPHLPLMLPNVGLCQCRLTRPGKHASYIVYYVIDFGAHCVINSNKKDRHNFQ